MKRFIPVLLLAPLLTACDDTTGPAGTAPVELRFATVASGSALVDASSEVAGAPASLTVPADGGVFEIDDVRLIVSEFELEGTETCTEIEDDGEIEMEECEFEGGPRLVDLPLDGGMISLGTDAITEGTYTFLEFEVEDLELDEEDADDSSHQAALEAILADVQAAYPGFPAGASMVVSGQYVPDTGDPLPFTVYFDAEIEIEMALNPHLVVPGDDVLTVQVDPGLWFTGFDFMAANEQTVEFELEMEDGFVEVEVGDD